MNNPVSRYLPTILTLLAVIGISIFVVYFNISFPDGGGRQYEYSSPMAAMWTGIGTMWFSIAFLLWWVLSRNLATRKTDTRQGLVCLYVWVVYSMLFGAEGILALIGWAQAKNEAAASALSILWVLVGGLVAAMAVGLVRAKRSTSSSKPVDTCSLDVEDGTNFDDEDDGEAMENGTDFDDEDRGGAMEDGTNSDKEDHLVGVETKKARNCCCRCCCCCCCCCTKSFWVNFCSLFLVTFLFLFSTGFMMLAAASASDAKRLIPPGTIYSFPITLEDGTTTVDLQMHLYCFGEKKKKNNNATTTTTTATSPTVILEHGGGANSITMLALAQELQSTYDTRTCVYDRLGYGYTPTYYTSTAGKRLPNSGVILSKLLEQAGEEGPYVCAGHSAGGEACLWFAHEQQQQNGNDNVQGVALMDGYPDLIRAGSFRPGIHPTAGEILPMIQIAAVLTGGTGLTRGLVGDLGESFVPFSERNTVIALYGQARFWFCQYWDVRMDVETSEESRLYQQLNGSIVIHDDDDADETNGKLVTYGGTLSGTKILVLPAETTTTDLDCQGNDKDNFCCNVNNKDSTQCQDQALDRTIYRAQNDLYATTLSNDTVGLVIPGPAGSEHGFVNHKDYYQWVATQIGEQLLLM